MDCPKCGAIMVVDEWGSWRWTCFNCDHVGREATDEKCEKQQRETEEYLKGKHEKRG